MPDSLTLSLDAMGGDAGPEMVLPAAAIAAERHPKIDFLLFGDEQRLRPLLDLQPRLKPRARIHHCDVAIAMNDKPSQALRQGRGKSSMWQTVDAVKRGEAHAAVSAGNTGALMAMSRFILKMIPGIERPALAGQWPTLKGQSVVLDLGATIGADARQLLEFAVMGEAMASCLFGLKQPSVGLLNVGVEEIKGLEEVKKAGRLLRELKLPIHYHGFVEGDDIGKGTVDVVVTEGFTGNIAVKTAEGTARMIGTIVRDAMTSSLLSKFGAVLANSAFRTIKSRLDPSKLNGGLMLGLNGIVVKAHGSSDSLGYATAIDVAVQMAKNGLTAKIAADVEEVNALLAQEPGNGITGPAGEAE